MPHSSVVYYVFRHILIKFEFSLRTLINVTSIKFNENTSDGAELYHADRRKNRSEASSPFQELSKLPKKRSYCVRLFHRRKLEIILGLMKFNVVMLSGTVFASV